MSDAIRRFAKLGFHLLVQERFRTFMRFFTLFLAICVAISSISIAYAPQTVSIHMTSHLQTLAYTNLFETTKEVFFTEAEVKSEAESLVILVEETPEAPVPRGEFLTSSEPVPSSTPIPAHLYLHFYEDSESEFYWIPETVEERISENDILVDLSAAIDPEFAYELSEDFQLTLSLVVDREAGNQPFLGLLLAAEDLVDRIRSGLYGLDIKAILVSGYQVEMDESGNLHVYRNSTEEILEASQAAQDAVRLALSGSRVSSILLQAVTEFRNEQYGLQLDDTYYKYGAIYHYNPELVSEAQLQARGINRVPVSFQFCDHIFYGRWLPESAQLDL